MMETPLVLRFKFLCQRQLVCFHALGFLPKDVGPSLPPPQEAKDGLRWLLIVIYSRIRDTGEVTNPVPAFGS